FARIAIERLDADSALRSPAKLDELLDAYARTYGVECSPAERDSAHYTCSRRFHDFPGFPAPVDPVPTQSRAKPLDVHDRPCAAEGLTSYRCRGAFGWIMIGAKDASGAISEARRSS